MAKRNIFLMISLLLLPGYFSAQAQLRRASDYFPLQIGNIWEYDNTNEAEYLFYEVVSDSLLGDSVRVYEVKRSGLKGKDLKPFEGAPYYYHYSADSTVVYRDDFEFPQMPYSGLPVIDTRHGILGLWHYLIGDLMEDFAVVDTGFASYFGETRHWAEVYGGGMYPDSTWSTDFYWRFVDGIGIVRQGEEPNALVDTLVYARINGIGYGITVKVQNRDESFPIPDNLKLQVYPNPVYGSSAVHVVNAELREIELRVVNLLGQTVRTVFRGKLARGQQTLSWDGKDDRGNRLVNGIYFLIIKSPKSFKAQKFIYLQN